MTGRRNLRLAAAVALCLGVGGIHAAAADDPAFSFAAPAKPAEVKPAGTSWAPGYVPLADRLDTRTELLFVYSFL